jgi:hypothetical protein
MQLKVHGHVLVVAPSMNGGVPNAKIVNIKRNFPVNYASDAMESEAASKYL